MRQDSNRTVLLLSNTRPTDNSGRSAKFNNRKKKLEQLGWNVKIGYINPTLVGSAKGFARWLRLARSVDIINSVSNPPELQIVGGLFARLTRTPWVAEFRDPLVKNPDVDPDSVAASLRQKLERYIVSNADAVIWYDGIQIKDDYFETNYTALDLTSVEKLPPIGFDSNVFDAADPTDHEKFTITYAGSFYDGWIEPHTFLCGLGKYISPEQEIEATFYGDWSPEYSRVARENGVYEYISDREFVPHGQIVSILKGSDALLYIGGDNDRNALNIPSKLYDYIGAGQPIIAIIDPGFRAATLVEENGLGIVVEPGDYEGVAAAIENIRTGRFTYEPSTGTEYTRRQSREAYLDVLKGLF